MMRFGWMLATCLAVGLAACEDEPRNGGRASELLPFDAEELAAVPQATMVYRQAREAAEQEITTENARERLTAIERAVEREEAALR